MSELKSLNNPGGQFLKLRNVHENNKVVRDKAVLLDAIEEVSIALESYINDSLCDGKGDYEGAVKTIEQSWEIILQNLPTWKGDKDE